MPKRKRGGGGRGWDHLAWKESEAKHASLGDADDCFMFTLEEVDGSEYVMEKDELGGVKVLPRGTTKGPTTQRGGGKEKVNDDDDEEEEGGGGGYEEVAEVEADDDDDDEEDQGDGGEEEEVVMDIADGDSLGGGDEEEGAGTDSKTESKAKRKKKRNERRRLKKRQKRVAEEAAAKAGAPAAGTTGAKQEPDGGAKEVVAVDLPAWASHSLGGVELHPLLLRNLARQGFVRPTPIQQATIPIAMAPGKAKDLMGAAETGSGKTLAYGLPILDALLKRRDEAASDASVTRGPLASLVLCPTRELAMQVTSHLKEMLVGDEAEGKRRLNVVTIVGGLADVKQERMLARKPEVVVATVGRLWELMSNNEPHLKNLSQVKFLVLDEADRMVEQGHYPELGKVLGAMMDQQRSYQRDYQEKVEGKKKGMMKKQGTFGDEEDGEEDVAEEDEGDLMAGEVPVVMLDDVLGTRAEQEAEEEDDEEAPEEEEGGEDSEEEMAPPVKRQTLIFSATLVMPEELRKGKGKKGKGGKGGQGTIVAKIMRRVGLRGKPAIVDLTTAASTTPVTTTSDKAVPAKDGKANGKKGSLSLPEGLKLSFIKTVPLEKDLYTYYFLRHFPGRTLIFTNSIENVRRLARLLTALTVPCRALHAKMQQRQRLKSMDHFRSSPQAVLVATDVAARGLDIPQVDHVIHYDLPRSLEVFVHRSGRTARAQREGVSFSLVGPRDERMHAEVSKVLLPPDDPMPSLPIDLVALGGCRERVNLAVRVVKHELEEEKRSASQSWLAKAAREADLDLDEGMGQEESLSQGEKVQAAQLVRDKERLAELLQMPLVVERRKFIDVASKLKALDSQAKTALELIERKKAKKSGKGSRG